MTNNLQSAAVSDRGLSEKRPQNEDSFLEMSSRGVFAVADGVGGAQAGDVASQMAMEILQEAFANSPNGSDAEELMRIAIERANEAIYQMSHDLPQLSTMATTVVALHVDGNIATIGHVGDSRLYRIDGRGNLYRETNDHSVVEEEVRAGRMTPAQAASHPSRNVISRALGADTAVDVELKTIMVEPNTTFLLCSDGITRHIEDHELRELLTSADSLDQVCEDMKHICYSRGAEDNLTAVIVRISEAIAGTDDDFEENTITASRPPLVSNAAFEHSEQPNSEMGFQDQGISAGDDFQTQELSGSPQILAEPSTSSNGSNDEAVVLPAPTPEVQDSNNAVRDEKVYAVEENRGGSALGKLLGSLLLLLIGAGVGAGAYYFWDQSQVQAPAVRQQEAPQITQMQTPNIAYSAFEDNRRNVDRDPQKFIEANGTAPDNAEDFYLLGRAYLLTGKYVEAKNAFMNAKTRLAELDNNNQQMLANEIALGLAIVDSRFAKDVLEAEMKGAIQNPGQVNNTNANTANAPIDTEIKPLNENTNANIQ